MTKQTYQKIRAKVRARFPEDLQAPKPPETPDQLAFRYQHVVLASGWAWEKAH